MAAFYIYMLRCADNSVYTGITTDLNRRFAEHSAKNKKSAKYTLSHSAEKFECIWQAENRRLASALEYRIKALTKNKKEQLISNPDLLSEFLGDKLDSSNYIKIKTED